MKIFGTILTIIVFGFIGFVAFIIALLSRDASFYAPFVAIVTIGIIAILNLAIYGKLSKRIPKRLSLLFAALCVLSIGAYEGYQFYIKSLEVVSTQDVDLSNYRPFAENTKAVTLEKESTFTIDNNLPKLDGSTALYPVFAAFAKAVYPEKDYPLEDSEVVSTQTSNAYNRLLNGEVDIIFMPKPSDIQLQSAEQRGIELTMTPIGQEAFVFFVNGKNPVQNLTIEQIQGIYSGEITNWNEVGGKDEEIQAFQRPEGSGSQSALNSVMDGKPLMEAPAEEIVSGMGGIIREISNFQNRSDAIGFSFRYFSQDMVQNGKIDFIAIEGVPPTIENIQNETYPIVDYFYAITADSKNPHVKDFIKWMVSNQGQQIVEMTGYVPVK